MVRVFLVFFGIWVVITALLTFMGYGLFPDNPLINTGIYACLISWCVALGITSLFSVSKHEINQIHKEDANRAKYTRHPGGAANMHKGFETTTGRLCLFPKNLIFHPRSYKVEMEDVTIPYETIADVRVDEENKHHLCVETKEGDKFFFSVADKEKWINDINEAIMSQHDPS